MAGVKFPSSFDVTGRFPLDSKYWVASQADLNTGEIYVGLHRWTLDTGKEYFLQKNNVWKLVGGGESSTIAIYKSGNPSTGTISWSLGPDAPLDYRRYRYTIDPEPMADSFPADFSEDF